MFHDQLLQGEFSEDEEVDVARHEKQYHLTDLREYTEYSFYVSAFNDNGEGGYSDEITCRTYSDLPADPPQNVTVEPASSSSVIGRWSNNFQTLKYFLGLMSQIFFHCSSVGAATEGVSERSVDWVQVEVEEVREGFRWQRWNSDSVN